MAQMQRQGRAGADPTPSSDARDAQSDDVRAVRRTLVAAAVVTLAIAAAAIILWDRLAPAAIEWLYHDARFGPLHDLIRTHAQGAPDHRDPAYYVRNGRLVLTRALIVAVGLEILAWALVFRRRTVRFARAFFGAAEPPTSLAVFRIVLFGVLLIKVAVTDTAYYSQLPEALRMPPLGTGWLSTVVPIDVAATRAIRAAFYFACTAAILGLCSRTSAALALLLGAYQLGVPQIFGSMNADHHLLWFAAILAVSRCGDVLALDAVRAAWRDADRGVLEPPPPSREYALPLRFVWLLLGIIYFFPGFWKVWRAGLEWITAENLRLHLLLKWTEFHDWMPFFRADGYPTLLFLCALGTVVFEVGFIFLVFTARGRRIAALSGLAFHNGCWVLLNISFWLLQLMYVALFDWAAIFRRVGGALFPEPMFVVYDGSCRLCRRTVATFRRFDVLMRITWVNGPGGQAMDALGLRRLDRDATAADLYAIVGSRVSKGFDAYGALAPRIPVLWALWPVLMLSPVERLARRLHRHVADRRAWAVVPAPPPFRARPRWALLPVTAVGVALVTSTVAFGMALQHMAWPIFCFPTFSWLAGPTAKRLRIDVTHADGHVVPLDIRELNSRQHGFTPERLQGLVIAIFEEPAERRDNRLRALWRVLAAEADDLADVTAVRFYRETITTDPERRHELPLERELLYQLSLA